MRAGERRADAVGEMRGDQPVGRLALGRHGAALGIRDLLARRRAAAPISLVLEAAVAEAQRAHQRAMHEQVGVAADRRGEVRVAAQVQAEVADVVGGVVGLALAAQHHLVDEVGDGQRLGAREDAVEVPGLQRRRLRQLHAERLEELAQARRASPSRAGRGRGRRPACASASSVSAAATLAWIMNSSISRCASSRSGVTTLATRPLLVEHDLALGQVEVERLRACRAPRRRAA